MKYIEAKERLEALVADAKDKLDIVGVEVTSECEVAENSVSDTEAEPLMILASLALSAEGLSEDDTYYISAEAVVEDGEVNEDALNGAIERFNARVDEAAERLGAAADPKEMLLTMGKEIDEELERIYNEEVARSERAMKKDIKIALLATLALALVVIAAVVISRFI
ncbi:MAG: hypothetical protein IKC32_06215 [Clostridia bacterium]|nr:hypothetical protein [Clostridia bacterium]